MLLALLGNPIISCLVGFMLGAFIFYVRGLFKQRALKKEVTISKAHVIATMDEHRLNVDKIKYLEELVNNQRVTIQLLKEKPNSRDLRELRRYAEAHTMMTRTAPGFAQAWQLCLDEIAKKENEEEKGLIIFRPIQKCFGFFKKKTALISENSTTAQKINLISQEHSVNQEK